MAGVARDADNMFAASIFKRHSTPVLATLKYAMSKKHYLTHVSQNLLILTQKLDDEEWEASVNDEVSALLACINTRELERQASALNGGKTCSFSPGQHMGEGAIMGCANYHAWLTFADGEKWLARIPRNNFSDFPDTLIEYLVESEYATLKFLEGTSVPAPRVYGYALASNERNAVGVNYLLLEVLPGSPFLAYQASDEQIRRVYEQLAGILAEIKRHSFSSAGSLRVQVDGKIDMGPVASNRFLSLGQYGPFDTSRQYFESIAEQHLDLIADGQLHPEYPAEAFVYYAALLCDMKTALNRSDDTIEGFYLKHVDDKGDHLLVDAEGNITGIIDWQFARCVPAAEAFGPSIFSADVGALCEGRWVVNENDKRLASALNARDEPVLAAYAEGIDRTRRFHWGLASGLFKEEVLTMIKNLLNDLEMVERTNFTKTVADYAQLRNFDTEWPKIKTVIEEALTTPASNGS